MLQTNRSLGAVEVEKQYLGRGARCDRDRAFGRDTDAITRGQDELAEADLSVNEVEPRASPWVELMRHVLSGLEQGRAYQRVLVDLQRTVPGIGRCDDTQAAPSLRRAESFLLAA